MNKLTALIEAAKVANAFCIKCGYMGPDEPTHQGCDYMAKRTAVVPADTILELCALLEKAEEALAHINEYWCGNRNDLAMFDACNNAVEVSEEPLAAIKQWKEQT